MKTLLTFLVLLFLCGTTLPTQAQYEINSSVWMDEYTVQHHINQYLSNVLFSYEYYQKWNSEEHQFESALPARLTYTPFASKNIKVEALELDYTQRYKLFEWDNFTENQLDSLMKGSKNLYTTLMNYDAHGRITSSVYRNFEHKPAGERIDYSIAYNPTDTLPGFTVEVSWSEGLILHKKSTSIITYALNKNQQILQVNGSHQSARENILFENTYSYDSLGRLTSFIRVPTSEVYIDRNYDYTITPFLLDSAKNNYNMLKIPSVQHWLRPYADSGLNIISYQN